MKFAEVHFENAKGHAVVLLKQAEEALEESNREYAGWSLDDAHSYLTTMRQETEREGVTDAVRAKYEEIAARYNAAKEKYEKTTEEANKRARADAQKHYDKTLVILERDVDSLLQNLAYDGDFDAKCISETLAQLRQTHDAWSFENDRFCEIRRRFEYALQIAEKIRRYNRVRDAFFAY